MRWDIPSQFSFCDALNTIFNNIDSELPVGKLFNLFCGQLCSGSLESSLCPAQDWICLLQPWELRCFT